MPTPTDATLRRKVFLHGIADDSRFHYRVFLCLLPSAVCNLPSPIAVGDHGRMVIFCKSSGKSNSKKFRERVQSRSVIVSLGEWSALELAHSPDISYGVAKIGQIGYVSAILGWNERCHSFSKNRLSVQSCSFALQKFPINLYMSSYYKNNKHEIAKNA